MTILPLQDVGFSFLGAECLCYGQLYDTQKLRVNHVLKVTSGYA